MKRRVGIHGKMSGDVGVLGKKDARIVLALDPPSSVEGDEKDETIHTVRRHAVRDGVVHQADLAHLARMVTRIAHVIPEGGDATLVCLDSTGRTFLGQFPSSNVATVLTELGVRAENTIVRASRQ